MRVRGSFVLFRDGVPPHVVYPALGARLPHAYFGAAGTPTSGPRSGAVLIVYLWLPRIFAELPLTLRSGAMLAVPCRVNYRVE